MSSGDRGHNQNRSRTRTSNLTSINNYKKQNSNTSSSNLSIVSSVNSANSLKNSHKNGNNGNIVNKDVSPKCQINSKKNIINSNKCNSRAAKRNNFIRNEITDWSQDQNPKQINNFSKNFNKKVNLTHLLNVTFEENTQNRKNFNCPSKNQNQKYGVNTRSENLDKIKEIQHKDFSGYTKQHYNHYTKLSKINHVRTHCQTLLRKNSISVPSLSELNQDINMYIEWDNDIAGLQFYQDQLATNLCAICLSDKPIAPRSTRCGHIFCFPCILHHFSVFLPGSNNISSSRQRISWHKCPICHKEILKKKLKPARIILTEDRAEINSNISFNLMTRKKSSIFATLSPETEQSLDENLNISLSESCFSWIGIENEIKMLLQDLENLKFNLKTAETTEISFFNEAIEITNFEVENMRRKLEQNLEEIETNLETPNSQYKICPIYKKKNSNISENIAIQYYQSKNRRMFLHPVTKRLISEQFSHNKIIQKSESSQEQSSSTINTLDSQTPTSINSSSLDSTNTNNSNYSDSDFNFNLPKIISGKVVQIDTIHVYEDIVKRFKFLNHLPQGTTVTLVELAIGSIKFGDELGNTKRLIFNKEILNKMRPALNKRKYLRENRKNIEKKYEQTLNVEELEDELYVYSDSDFLPFLSKESKDFFNEPIEFQGIDYLINEKRPENTIRSTKSSFGLAAKMADLNLNKSNLNQSSFGFAAKMRNTNKLNENSTKTLDFQNNFGNSADPLNFEEQVCFVHIKKGKNKKGNRKKFNKKEENK